jgi:hypothetical protein
MILIGKQQQQQAQQEHPQRGHLRRQQQQGQHRHLLPRQKRCSRTGPGGHCTRTPVVFDAATFFGAGTEQ